MTMIPFLLLAGLLLGNGLLGLALLGLAPVRVLARLSRLELGSLALLLGQAFSALLVLFAMFAGAQLSGWYWAACSLAAVLLVLFQLPKWRALPTPRPAEPLYEPPVRLFIGSALVVCVVWTISAAMFLPTVDYDGLATWSYRVRVLHAERSLYVESLRDHVRLVPMRQHPYLLPVMETAPVLAVGRFSFAATHTPHLAAWLAFLGLSLALARRLLDAAYPRRAGAAFAALALLPAAHVQLSQESVREMLIGFYGMAAVYSLIRWAQSPRWLYLLLATFFGLVTQQIKVEGVPFALGLVLGAGLLVVASDRRTCLLRALQWTTAAGLAGGLALPWWIVLNRMPFPTVHGYDFTADLDASIFDKLRSIPVVARLTLAELFARPELYGLTAWAAAVALARGWTRRNALLRLAMLAAPAACLAGILAVYVGRNDRLPPERNVTFSRRILCVVPALAVAAFWIPRERKSTPRRSFGIGGRDGAGT